uniref:Uncharacterized protein n=1 Tax=Romanomermis culicivorax TaxID=13658 RepID=A0A915HV58_ROMCU
MLNKVVTEHNKILKGDDLPYQLENVVADVSIARIFGWQDIRVATGGGCVVCSVVSSGGINNFDRVVSTLVLSQREFSNTGLQSDHARIIFVRFSDKNGREICKNTNNM